MEDALLSLVFYPLDTYAYAGWDWFLLYVIYFSLHICRSSNSYSARSGLLYI